MKAVNRFTLILTLCFFALAASKIQAQVRINRVQFNDNVPPYQWSNIVIELQAERIDKAHQAPITRYANQIKVLLTLAYKHPNTNKYEFYQSEATLVSLEIGKRKQFAFWMPQIIVERDRLSREPDYWSIDLTVNGKPITTSNSSHTQSKNFKNRESLQNFKQQAKNKAQKNTGILVPTYLSPNPYIDTRTPPAFIRK